ncbi:hypothetical protein [Terriglobus sp.]|uniref:hypothetical protein n=1 Tax=Terriglobus sp. TaxID=1889013 RepID=UPI003AFF65DA
MLFRRLAIVLLAVSILPGIRAQVSAETESSMALLQHAVDAAKANHLEDAVFYFYAGQLRRRLEVALFPPNSDEDAEGVYAFQYTIGQSLNLAASDDPAASLRALDRYDRWKPTVAPGFKPLWPSAHPVKPAAVLPQIEATKRDFSVHMRLLMTLLEDPEYFKQFHIARDCNMAPVAQRPAGASCKAAHDSMFRIEKQRGVEGMESLSRKE